MAYPGQFHRLVLIGTLYADVFNVTLSIVPTSGTSMPAVTQALADDVAATVRAWWILTAATTGIGISSSAVLQSIKLNRIGPDGRYVDAEVIESTVTPAAGGGASGMHPQISLCATIRGANERARAGKGRMYFPPCDFTDTLAGDGRMLGGNTANAAQRVHQLLQNIGGEYVDRSVAGLPGIASRAGAGAFQVMQRVSVGRVPDTVRSRRSKQAEDPVFFPA